MGVVDEILLAAPHDLHLAAALLGAPPHVDRFVLLSVDDSGRAEGFGVELGAAFVFHTDRLGVHLTTGAMHHKQQHCHLEELGLLACWAWRVAHGVRGDFSRDGCINLLRGVKAIHGSQDAQEVKVG